MILHRSIARTVENVFSRYDKIPKINWESILIASIKPCFSELRCDLLTLTLKNLLRDIGTSSGGSASAGANPHLSAPLRSAT